MPMDRKRYPKDWKIISLKIRVRDGWKCKFCGIENGALRNGHWVVLTVAHLHDPDPMNCSDDNLAALCQRCHNRLDMPMRQRHASETRRQRKIDSGQQELFEEEVSYS